MVRAAVAWLGRLVTDVTMEEQAEGWRVADSDTRVHRNSQFFKTGHASADRRCCGLEQSA
jgi:hypothetical protein